MEPDLTAVIVPVPEAEPLVGDLRHELDPSASGGVPAHVTVMYPFLAPPDIDLAALREVVARAPAFTATFRRVDWFGDDVVWLAPEPAAPFVALTVAVRERFGLVPYGGAYGLDPVPHLTVGHGAPRHRLRAAAAELEAGPAGAGRDPGRPAHRRLAPAELLAHGGRAAARVAMIGP